VNPIRFGGITKRSHRHVWRFGLEDEPPYDPFIRCRDCGKDQDERSSRGKRARRRGNDFERTVARRLGVSRVGQYGGPEDVGAPTDWIAIQTKVGNATYPTRIDALLRRIPVRSAQLRAVVHGDSPGTGSKRRALITLDLDEFADWFGSTGRAE
jgi:hypothetical protein